LITSQEEREHLAELNLIAAKRLHSLCLCAQVSDRWCSATSGRLVGTPT
jgi:hypothetical protein